MFRKVIQKIQALYQRAFKTQTIRRIVRNSSYLVSANVFSAAMGMLQNMIRLRIVDLASIGLLSAIDAFTKNLIENSFFWLHCFAVSIASLGGVFDRLLYQVPCWRSARHRSNSSSILGPIG